MTDKVKGRCKHCGLQYIEHYDVERRWCPGNRSTKFEDEGDEAKAKAQMLPHSVSVFEPSNFEPKKLEAEIKKFYGTYPTPKSRMMFFRKIENKILAQYKQKVLNAINTLYENRKEPRSCRKRNVPNP